MQFKLGRAAGIDVFIHWTFFLAPLYVVYETRWIQKLPWSVSFVFVLLLLAVFACVLLHEYGHALMARRFGVKTRDIIVTPIGGIARLERMPRNPFQELLITFAGPAVNLVIAGLLLIGLAVFRQPLLPTETAEGVSYVPQMLMLMNLLLFFFNLIPAFPMDGGRILRSCLALFIDFHRATIVAGRVGQVLAVIFFLGGILNSQVSLVVIGIFVFVAARYEMINSTRFQREANIEATESHHADFRQI